MRPCVIFSDPEHREHELVPGDVIGRLWTAALQIPDGRISEAHAMVSLRDGQLQLIRLRGGLAVEGLACPMVLLEPGLRVTLAPGVALEVVAVHLPEAVLGIEGPSVGRQALAGVCSIVVDDTPRLVRRWVEGAALQIWNTGDAWLCRAAGGAPRPFEVGDEHLISGFRFSVVSIPLKVAGPSDTRLRDGAPLRIVAWFDTVHLHREGEPAVILAGRQGRLVSELVAIRGPVPWRSLAQLLWPTTEEEHLLRGRLDVVLTRIRRHLRSHGVRGDLVRTDGTGMVEIVVYPPDRVEDHT